jgi:hypothetical protein
LRWQAATVKTGAKAVSHGRYDAFQMADSRSVFAGILRLIAELRTAPFRRSARPCHWLGCAGADDDDSSLTIIVKRGNLSLGIWSSGGNGRENSSFV